VVTSVKRGEPEPDAFRDLLNHIQLFVMGVYDLFECGDS
jgi:hypothetical protein